MVKCKRSKSIDIKKKVKATKTEKPLKNNSLFNIKESTVSSGAPSKFSKKLAKSLCRDLLMGKTIKQACANNKIHHSTYYDWLQKDKFAKMATLAREISAHRYFENAREILEKVESGELNHKRGRLLFDAYLRLAGKANQKTFGNKRNIELSGKLDLDIVKRFDLFKKRTKKTKIKIETEE